MLTPKVFTFSETDSGQKFTVIVIYHFSSVLLFEYPGSKILCGKDHKYYVKIKILITVL